MNAIQWSNSRGSGVIDIRHYPSGEPLIELPRDTVVDRLLLRPTSMLDLMGGLFLVDAIQERGHPTPALILPFVPGARQDRLNDTGDHLFTAKSVAREINARQFPSVTILDPHSEVIAALVDRCRVVHAHECLDYISARRTYTAVISPDAGAEKRAGAVAKRLGVPLLHAWKTRDITDGKITAFGLEPSEAFTGGHVLVVDDICDGGGTFVGLSEVLKPRLLKADLYVTHGLFSQGTEKLLRHYFNIVCSDSIDIERPGVDVIPVCAKLLLKGS